MSVILIYLGKLIETALALETALTGITRSRRTTVVAVCDVCNRNRLEKCLKLDGASIAFCCDIPNRVRNPIGSDEIIERSVLACFLHETVDTGNIAIGQKRRTRVSVKNLDMASTIVFLVLAGLLVLLENAIKIIAGVEDGNDASLGMIPHLLAISVELALRFFYERTIGHQSIERLACLCIRLRRRTLRTLGKIDLGSGDMQEAIGIVLGKRLGLGRVDHIIRNGRDRCRVLCIGPYGRKRFNFHVFA